MVIIEKITKKYGNRTLFENFSCQLGETGIYGIVGESGLGKTTLLNIISSLDNDYEGKIIINGVNLKELKENDLRNFRYQNFGFIFQSYNLFEDETVYNNILMVLEGNKTSKQIKNQNINDVLKYLDIENIKDEYVQNLSGGEKQRVAIARAIINNPKIIFCDEPTGALDEENSTQIFRILKRIANKSLVILVSHDYENVKKYADEIIDFKILEMIKNEPSYSTKETFFIPQTNKISARLSFKIKKGRFLFSSLIFSLSLIFLGLTLYISSNVSESINKAFGNVINENSLVLEKKNNTEEVISYAASEEDIYKIVDKYNEDIEYFGCKYLVNFPSFFVSQNNFYIEIGDFPRLISFLSATNINEFNLLNKDVIDQAIRVRSILLHATSKRAKSGADAAIPKIALKTIPTPINETQKREIRIAVTHMKDQIKAMNFKQLSSKILRILTHPYINMEREYYNTTYYIFFK